MENQPLTDTGRLACRSEALRARLLRRWVARQLGRLHTLAAGLGAEAELRALDERELLDLGLDRGSIAHAARHGRFGPDHL
ncbi:MAG: hypothetical protein AB1421_07355 [Pseudomonadota bacterium]